MHLAKMPLVDHFSRIEDMQWLYRKTQQQSQDLTTYFTASEKRTTVSTDQILHLLESTEQRHARSIINYFDIVHNKSVRILLQSIGIYYFFLFRVDLAVR